MDTPVTADQPFVYRVRAVGPSNVKSELSAFVSAQAIESAPVLATPRNVRANAGIGHITITWSANTEAELIGYRVMRYTDPAQTEAEAAFMTVQTTYVDSPLVSGQTYVYRVQALGTNNEESEPSLYASATASVLAAPRNVQARGGISHITITWSANTEAELTGYRIMRYTDPAQTEAEATFNTVQTTYVDSPLVSGQTYVYRVQALGTNNEESERSLYASATVSADQSAPGAPSDLIVSLDEANFQRVTLSWTAPTRDSNGNELTGLASFEIYRSRGNNTSFALIATATSDQVRYEDTSVELLTTYFYAVRAVDQAGNAGPRSQPVSVTTKGFAIPRNLQATAGVQKITLTWAANTESELTGYEVLRFTDPTQATPERTFSSILTTYVDTTVTADQSYVYRVRAVGPSNVKSELSAPVFAQATAPVLAAPRNVRASAGIEYITITWSANTEAELTGYRVMRYTDPAQTEAEATFTTVQTTYSDAEVEVGRTYVYRVQAVGSNNEESELSLFASAEVLPDNSPPATPGNFVAALASTGTSIELRWDAPTRDTGGGILTGLTGFVIYRADTSNVGLTEIATVDDPTQEMYLDTGLENQKIYRYQISAVDHRGNESARSSIKMVTTTDLIVVPPSNLQASYNASGPAVDLSWTAPDEYDSFVVQRAILNPGTSSQDLTDANYTTLDFAVQTTSYSDSNITNGTIYVYRVRTNLSGRISVLSDTVLMPVP